jgi:hypothetical protein
MKCSELGPRVADYLVGDLDEASRSEIDGHLVGCALCRRELESLSRLWTKLGTLEDEAPSPALEHRFSAMLAGYREAAVPQRRAARGWSLAGWLGTWSPASLALQVGLALLFLTVGMTAGHYVSLGSRPDGDLATMRAEIHTMRRLVALSLLEQQSASERLRGVSYSRLAEPDAGVTAALLDKLNLDPNINVRLATVDALSKLADQPTVRLGLIESLARQDSPLVQIAVIDLLVQIHERSSTEALRRMVNDSTLNKTVRERAELGLRELS